MGGVFESPEPPAPRPEPAVEETAADPEAEARKARMEAIARRRRGRQDTIETGYGGAMLRERSRAPAGRRRLGG